MPLRMVDNHLKAHLLAQPFFSTFKSNSYLRVPLGQSNVLMANGTNKSDPAQADPRLLSLGNLVLKYIVMSIR